jgi:hypothetical protein
MTGQQEIEMATKIMATIADDGFGSQVDFTDETVMEQVHSDYLSAVESIAQKLYGDDVEIDVDFEPTNLGDKWFLEIDDEPVADFDGHHFGDLVWDKYCAGE